MHHLNSCRILRDMKTQNPYAHPLADFDGKASPPLHGIKDTSPDLYLSCKENPFFSKEAKAATHPSPPRTSGDGFFNTCYLEVSPKELLEVAKHLTNAAENPKEAIEKAYALITESYNFSRGVHYWNYKVECDHVSPAIHNLVEAHTIQSGENKGSAPRAKLLQGFEKLLGNNIAEGTASDRFNHYLKEEIRLEDFLFEIGYSPHSENHDLEKINLLYENKWIRQVNIGSSVLILPPERTQPIKRKRKPKPSEHPTEPYWNTKDSWWPEADPEILKKQREQILRGRGQFFWAYEAKKILQSYLEWRKIQTEAKKQLGQKNAEKRTKQGQFAGKKPKAKKC